jgi:hypothetical protein
MQDKPNGAGDDERATTAAQDLSDQGRVLNEVLSLYPETLTLDELVRELTVDSTEFAEKDRITRAVRDLISGGLIHRVGDLVLPTRAAVLYRTLED